MRLTYSSSVADVPFVDIVTTILDTSLPLTVIEWEEWGQSQRQNLL